MDTFGKRELESNANQPGREKHQPGNFEEIRTQLNILKNNSKLPMSPNE